MNASAYPLINLIQTVTWIPVKERLPTKHGEVMITTKHLVLTNGLIWNSENGRFEWFGNPLPMEIVIHWAEPLKHPNDLILEKKAGAM